MQAAKRAVAGEMACAPDEMVLVDNLTVAATIVAEGMLQECLLAREAEEAVILLNSFTYNAVRLAFEAAAQRAAAAGVRLRIEVAEMPFPIQSSDELLAAFEAQLQRVAAAGALGECGTLTGEHAVEDLGGHLFLIGFKYCTCR